MTEEQRQQWRFLVECALETPDLMRVDPALIVAVAARLAGLEEAGEWLAEMAGYAVDHLEPEWARRGGTGNSNALDLRDAVSKMCDALEP